MTAATPRSRLLMAAGGVALLWLALPASDGPAPFAAYGAAGGTLAYVLATVAVAAVLALLPASSDATRTRIRRLTALLILVLLVVALSLDGLQAIAAASLLAVVWAAAIRYLPRLGLALLVLVGAYSYVALVIVVVGLLLVPGSLAEFGREIWPRRIGAAP